MPIIKDECENCSLTVTVTLIILFSGNVLLVLPVSAEDEDFEEMFLNKRHDDMKDDLWLDGLIHTLQPTHTSLIGKNITMRDFKEGFDFSNR